MSAALRGLSQGLQTGLQMGSVLRDVNRRRALQEEAAQYGVTEGAYGPELLQNIQQVEQMRDQALSAAPEGQDLDAIRAQYDPSIAELQRRRGLTAPDFSVASGAQNFGTREEATRAARPMRAEGLANVYERFGDIERAEELRERADAGRLREMQMEATGLDLQTRRRDVARTQEFDTGMAAINKQTFEAPEQRTAAILDLVEATQGPQARAQLEASYTSNQLNSISLDSAKAQQGFQQAFTKGLDATMKWLDSQDPGFTLERRGNQIIRIDADTNARSVFASGSDFEIMEQFAGMATPSNFLTLAQNRVNREIARDRMKQERSQFIQVEDAQGNLQVIDINRLPRGADGQPEMPAGLRRTGARAEKPLTPEQENAWKLAQKDDRFTRAANANDRPAMRAYLTARGIPLSVLPGLDEGPPGGGTMTPDAPAAPAAATDVAAETDTDAAAKPTEPSPARQRQLQTMGISALTNLNTVEQAARYGNPRAIAELERRQRQVESTAQRSQRLERGLQ